LLDQDIAGCGMTERDPRATDLTQDGGASRNFRDVGRLAKAHLANPLTKVGIACERTHPAGRASIELAERYAGCEGMLAHAGRSTLRALRLSFKRKVEICG
jgi:hypothetical protein